MSKISYEDFVEQFKNELEIQTQGFSEMDLKDVPEYDSMGKINASLVIERIFEFQIEFEYLDTVKDLKSLWVYCLQR
jgi:hypothetical protein